jgi:hypothetical protein
VRDRRPALFLEDQTNQTAGSELSLTPLPTEKLPSKFVSITY